MNEKGQFQIRFSEAMYLYPEMERFDYNELLRISLRSKSKVTIGRYLEENEEKFTWTVEDYDEMQMSILVNF